MGSLLEDIFFSSELIFRGLVIKGGSVRPFTGLWLIFILLKLFVIIRG